MRIYINPKYNDLKDFVNNLHKDFEKIGKSIYTGRNEVKVIDYKSYKLNVKAFKIPNLINKVAYAWIRGSKAKHSFEYALKMRSMGAETPEPIAYIEILKNGLFNKGYYVSIQHPYDFTIRELIGFNFLDKDNILRQLAVYSYEKLHKNGIHHLDFSRGNILITDLKNGKYLYSVVDINRMRFEKMPYLKGLKNFSQLWANEDELEIIARAYAKINGKEEEQAIKMLNQFDKDHKKNVKRKEELKRKIRGNK